MLATARRIVDARTELPVRIGVHRGAVFAGDVGPPYRRTYTVMGDTVNLAARLMGAAAAGPDRDHRRRARPIAHLRRGGAATDAGEGQAQAGARVQRGRRPARAGRGRLGRREPAAVRGPGRRDADARPHARGGARRGGDGGGDRGPAGHRQVAPGRRARGPGPRLPFAGGHLRAVRVEHAVLRAVVAAPPRARGRRGHAGGRGGVAPHGSRARPTRRTSRRGSRSSACRSTSRSPRRRRPPPSRHAFAASAPRRPPRRSSTRTSPQPTILVFEDTQWIDEASRELVELLVAKTEGVPWVIACTRVGDAPPIGDAASRSTSSPSARRRAPTRCVRATEDAPLLPHQLDALTARAEGNPLFLTELLRVVREAPVDGGDQAPLPDSIDALVTAQIDRLAPTRRRLLRYAAVLGRSFSLRDLEALLSGELAVPDQRTWAELADFVELEGAARARFRHALIRDTAYEELSYRRRRELHGRAARMLEQTPSTTRSRPRPSCSRSTSSPRSRIPTRGGTRASPADGPSRSTPTSTPPTLFERALAAARRLPELPPDGDGRRVGAARRRPRAQRGVRRRRRRVPLRAVGWYEATRCTRPGSSSRRRGSPSARAGTRRRCGGSARG